MKTRTKLGALVAAGAMAFVLVGTAFAEEGNQTNVAWNAGASDCTGGPGGTTIDPGEGNVAWVFVHTSQSGPGHLDANFQNAGAQGADSYIQGGLKYLIITSAPDTLLNFSDNLSGGQLTLSHTCYNSESSQPAESQPEESTPESVPPSFTSTEFPATDVPSEPNTATIGSSSGGPSDSSWLLVAALGVLLASVVVMTPARAKNRR